jgi:hypothetical protein
MGIFGSIVLLAVGAILAFAVSVDTSGVNIHMVGDILLAAGALGLIVSVALVYHRRITVDHRAVPPSAVEERHYYDGPAL